MKKFLPVKRKTSESLSAEIMHMSNFVGWRVCVQATQFWDEGHEFHVGQIEYAGDPKYFLLSQCHYSLWSRLAIEL